VERYVQRKLKRGREYFYFRVVRDGRETRIALPHPFDAGYRAAYDAAHRQVFGTTPGEFDSPTSVARLVRDHKDSARYRALPKASRTLRDLACDLLVERWGQFEAQDIRTLHVQALYDSLSERPATANRRLDDISAVFGWGQPRGFCDANPCRGIERVKSDTSYEPWPTDRLQLLIDKGKPEIVKVALVAVYTGQRREDILRRLTDAAIRDGVWQLRQGKTATVVPVPLHPVVLAILDLERQARRKSDVVDPRRPLLTNSRGRPWTPTGFGASWRTELIRLKLRPRRLELLPDGEFRPTLHGLRHTSATHIANAVARNAEVYGGIARVQAMLGHLSEAMSKHYARRAEVEHLNQETLLLLPEIGNRPAWIGNPDET
jgi:integrase